eukprot:gnl/MRDRNA2_/MRDRNA2_83473_c0_seq3.p1 gnl/MRDRNA2_/MRDRNA2_83473_c0~~gnl/MRDRNA2_/MRDRNA2_83473_c0_seq3.p1  ORF type:complete len:415 (+),score=81.86 gnl/MRDRNA2_/MRDRNA2_83473_c0_seq3:103-1245(+)
MSEFHTELLGGAPAGPAVFPQWAGVPISVLVMAGIAYAYRGYGAKGLTGLMVYITALITVQLTMKQVLKAFPYPCFMSTIHFIFTLAGVHVALKVAGESHPDMNFTCPKFQKWYLKNIVPTCICQYLAIALNNVSLIYIGAGINAMIGLATPVVTALVAAVFGMKIVALAWVGVLLTVAGDGIITLDGFSVTAAEGSNVGLFIYGVSLSVFAMGTRGAKTVLQDKLMNNYGNDEEHKNLTPLQSWAMQGPLLIALGMLGTVVKEGLAPWQALPAAVASPALLFMILNVMCAACLNISAVYAIKMLGAPAAQIAGKLNVLVVASLSCALLGETLTLKQGASTILIIGGATLFEKAQKNKINTLKGFMAHVHGEKYDATEKC